MKKNNSVITVSLIFIAFCCLIYVLYIGAPIIVPFVLALFFSFIVLSISGYFQSKGFPKYVALIASLTSIFLILSLVSKIIDANVADIVAGAPVYQEKLIEIIQNIQARYGISDQIISENIVSKIDIPNIVSTTATMLTSIVTNTGIIALFTIFILLESTSFHKKMLMITGNPKAPFFQISSQIQDDIQIYFLVKTRTSFLVALLSLIVMFFFKIDFLFFWAFLIFLLNYIPNVGSIIAVTFPVLFSLIQFNSLPYTLAFAAVMIAAQVIVGNFIEPRLMGNKLNLSPLVILISLIFWGTLWGPVGMLLSVPIMVIINIVLAHIPATRNIAILLSENGNVYFPEKETVEKKLSFKQMKKVLKKSNS